MAHHEEFDPVRVNNAIDRDREAQRERERLVQEARREQQRLVQEATRKHNQRVEHERQNQRRIQEAIRDRERGDFSTAEGRAMEDHVSLSELMAAPDRRDLSFVTAEPADFIVDPDGTSRIVADHFDLYGDPPTIFDFGHDDPPTVDERLRGLAHLYEERQAMYGDNYKRFGDIMLDLFPDGLELNDEHDFNRAGLLMLMVYKLTRYAAQFYNRGGHPDSLDDLSVYTQMLREIDADQEKNG